MRLEALGVCAWVEALLGNVEACRGCCAAAGAVVEALGVTLTGGMAAGLLALSLGRYDDAVHELEAKLADASPSRLPFRCGRSWMGWWKRASGRVAPIGLRHSPQRRSTPPPRRRSRVSWQSPTECAQ